MVASVNKVTLIGFLGAGPELRHTPDGTAVCTLSVGTTERWKDKKTGEKQERTEWHRVQVWRANAEFVAEYLDSGAYVYVEGKNQTQKWTDSSGTDRYTTVVVGRIDPLDRKGAGAAPAGKPPADDTPPPSDEFDSD